MSQSMTAIVCTLLIFYSQILISHAELIECEFRDDEIYVNFHQMSGYGCKVKNVKKSGHDVTGVHRRGFDNDDVVFVNAKGFNLDEFDGIFCEIFKNLEGLQLQDVTIGSMNENSLNNCRNLKMLSIVNGNIDEIPKNLLTPATNLKDIDFSQNNLRTLPENLFSTLSNLERLTLGINEISSLPDNIFKPLRNLRGLWLGQNRIKLLNPVWFENLRFLLELRLHGNKISEIGREIFKNMKDLEGLYLSYNRINTLESDTFADLNNLEILSIGYNEISDLPKGIFSHLMSLEELWLHGNKITEIHSDSFGTKTQLKKVSLQSNKITAIDEKFVDNTGVGYLDLRNNVCSRSEIGNRRNMKRELARCFESHRPRKNSDGDDDFDVHYNKENFNQNQQTTEDYSTKEENYRPNLACGISKIGIGNIIGGKQIDRGAFPWIAALLRSDSNEYFCGGTLISDKKVVTAAHCIENKKGEKKLIPREVKVLLGVHNLKDSLIFGLQVGVTKNIHIHDAWDPQAQSFDADIAVIVVEHKVVFTDYVQPICMAAINSNLASIGNGIVIGYGKSEDNSKKHEDIPKALNVPIHENSDCFLKFNDLLKLSSNRTFCGGDNKGSGVCLGDSGSGLFVLQNGAYFLRGIVSSSLKTQSLVCDIDKYSIYTDVLKFLKWINDINVDEVYAG